MPQLPTLQCMYCCHNMLLMLTMEHHRLAAAPGVPTMCANHVPAALGCRHSTHLALASCQLVVLLLYCRLKTTSCLIRRAGPRVLPLLQEPAAVTAHLPEHAVSHCQLSCFCALWQRDWSMLTSRVLCLQMWQWLFTAGHAYNSDVVWCAREPTWSALSASPGVVRAVL